MPSFPGTVPTSHHPSAAGPWCPVPLARQPFPKRVGIEKLHVSGLLPNPCTRPPPWRRGGELLSSPLGAQSLRALGSTLPRSRQRGVLKTPSLTPLQMMKQSSYQGEKASSEEAAHRPCSAVFPASRRPSRMSPGWETIKHGVEPMSTNMGLMDPGKPLNTPEPKFAWA